MVDAEGRIAAEIAYQRALTALHETREALAAVQAARRRLEFERAGLPSAEADARARDLTTQHSGLAGRAEELRSRAAALRDELRRAGGAAGEPVEPPASPEPGAGFVQPPFAGAGG